MIEEGFYLKNEKINHLEDQVERDPYRIEISAEDLANYLIGLSPENPENYPQILERLGEDRERIRAKYGLPPLEMLKNYPAEFERRLREIAQKIGVDIRAKTDCRAFFEKNRIGGAFFTTQEAGRPTIAMDIRRGEEKEYLKDLAALEHELVHAVQNEKFPRMPIELMEYEAYVANVNLQYLKEHPEQIAEVFFDFFIGGSVRFFYEQENKLRKAKGLPPLTPPYASRPSKDK